MIFGVLNPEKIWRENLTDLSSSTVENDPFWYHKVKWLHLTGEMGQDKSVRFSREIFSGFDTPKIIKIG